MLRGGRKRNLFPGAIYFFNEVDLHLLIRERKTDNLSTQARVWGLKFSLVWIRWITQTHLRSLVVHVSV